MLYYPMIYLRFISIYLVNLDFFQNNSYFCLFIHYTLMNEMKGQNWRMPWPNVHPTNGQRVFVHDSVEYFHHVSLTHVSNVLLPFSLSML
jgi:hypothetical protein